MRHRRSAERDAKALVEWVLGAELRPPPLGGHSHDIFESGTLTGTLVVVESPATSWVATSRPLWPAPGLTRSWVLQLAGDGSPAGNDRKVLRLLARLERGNVWHFSRSARAEGALSEVVSKLLGSGFTAGTSVTAHRCPAVVALATPSSGLGTAHVVNEVVEDEAWRAANRVRLAAAPRCPRHLFVWVDDADVLGRAAMERDVPPSPPVHPMEVTTLWAARRAIPPGGALADRVWQTNESGEWETLGAVSPPPAPRPIMTV